MTPSNACTTVMAIPRTAIAMRERTLVAISTVSNKATLREAAYRAKLSSLPGPSRPARANPALTPVLRSVTRAQLQNRFVIVSPFIALSQIRVPHWSCSEGYQAPDEALVVGGGLASIDVVKVLQLENYERVLFCCAEPFLSYSPPLHELLSRP